MQEAARVKGVQLPVLNARTDGEIDTAFASLGQLQAGGLVVSPDSFFDSRFEQLVALVSRYAVPTIWDWRGFPAAGGLISFGTDARELRRPGRHLRWEDFEGGEAGGSTGAAADQIRAGHQSEDGEGAGLDGPALNPRPRRRGYRMTANHLWTPPFRQGKT